MMPSPPLSIDLKPTIVQPKLYNCPMPEPSPSLNNQSKYVYYVYILKTYPFHRSQEKISKDTGSPLLKGDTSTSELLIDIARGNGGSVQSPITLLPSYAHLEWIARRALRMTVGVLKTPARRETIP